MGFQVEQLVHGREPVHQFMNIDEWAPPAAENDVILPNPGYRVDANVWHLNIR